MEYSRKVLRKFLLNSVSLFSDEPKRVMGRWNNQENAKQKYTKVDFSNQDHCGPCGQYNIPSISNDTTFLKRKPEKENIPKKNT